VFDQLWSGRGRGERDFSQRSVSGHR
jgi:hypothetical protein